MRTRNRKEVATMGLAQMQEAMARLYTDAALREQFFENVDCLVVTLKAQV